MILDNFPAELGQPRPQQIAALKFIEESFNNGIKVVTLDKDIKQ